MADRMEIKYPEVPEKTDSPVEVAVEDDSQGWENNRLDSGAGDYVDDGLPARGRDHRPGPSHAWQPNDCKTGFWFQSESIGYLGPMTSVLAVKLDRELSEERQEETRSRLSIQGPESVTSLTERAERARSVKSDDHVSRMRI